MFNLTRYRVAGCQAVLDREPGTIFEDDLDPRWHRFYLEGGHLTVIPHDPEPALPRLDDPQPQEGSI